MARQSYGDAKEKSDSSSSSDSDSEDDEKVSNKLKRMVSFN